MSTHPSHLQPISCITVDSASNFLLTGSPDSNIHVWSILSLLSFSHATSYSSDESLSGIVQTLSNHSGAITALVASRSHPSSSFAVSASEDNTCIVWDYRVGSVLHTFILTSTPLCLELDPACRAFYAGFDDGSVRLVDLYKRGNLINGALDSTSSSTASQPPSSSHWKVDGAESPALSLTLGYDGTILLSGHQDGKVHEWDVGRGKCESHSLELFAPVTNIHMLPPQGFLHGRSEASKSLTVVKPRYEHSLGSLSMASTDSVPDNYSSSTQFTAALTLPRIKASGSQLLDLMSEFNALLEDPSFPPSLLDEGLSALSANPQPAATIVPPSATDESFESEIRELKSQLLFIKSSRASLLSSSLNIADELERMKNAETARRRAKKVARIKRNQIEERRRRLAMGEHLSDREEAMDDDHASSDTDELAGSD